MKKIFIIIVILFCSNSCSDYKELNTLSYITGIGFDYVDNMYIVTYEVMDNQKDGQSVQTNTYIVTGTGSTTYEAHVNAASKLNKTAYYLHSQVVIITENITEDKLLDVTDSIIRNPKLNEEFLLVVTIDNTPEEIFSTTTTAWPSASFYIYSLIIDNEYSKNYYIEVPFAVFAQKINTNTIDPIVSIIKVENNEIILEGSMIFSDNYPVGILSNYESNIYNALLSSSTTIALSAEYNSSTVEVATYFSDVSITVDNENININLEVLSEIKKSDSEINLYDDYVYEKISDTISQEIKTSITDLIFKLQENNSDILGLSNYYYIYSRINNSDLWTDLDINIEIDSTISRKGIIYNVN